MSTRSTALFVAVAFLLLTSRWASAVTPEAECSAQKTEAAGERQLCLATEYAKSMRGEASKPKACERRYRRALRSAERDTVTKCAFAVGPGSLPRTGQTSCWTATGFLVECEGLGHDGEVRAGAKANFVDNGDGTISDLNTGLMWEKLGGSDVPSIHKKANVYSWFGAFADKVDLLKSGCFAGYCDWRLPNVRELQTIANLELAPPGPAVQSIFNVACTPGCTIYECSCTSTSTAHWSSTTYAGDPDDAWLVDFTNGAATAYRKTSHYHVRAVRGGL